MLQTLRLSRIPADDQLQAWNAADELLLKRKQEIKGNTLVVNDSFGAISLNLIDKNICCWSDSATSIEAIKNNAGANELICPEFVIAPFTDKKFETVVIQIPKSANYFSWLLQTIKPCLTGHQTVLALGMVKHINNAHIKAMNDHFHRVNPGRADKKARVIRLENPINTTPPIGKLSYRNPLTNERIETMPGCFSEKSIDPGARAFISYFDQLPAAKKCSI